MLISEFISKLNAWGAAKKPFLFIIDFEMEKPMAFLLDEITPSKILFNIEGFSNASVSPRHEDSPHILKKTPIAFDLYKEKFDSVYWHLGQGDSYLTNLTTKTEVALSHSLLDVFHYSKAKYKLWYKDEFIVFSPECFVKIINGRIYSFPMKGTIDSALPDARETILNDKKELAEHVTIVDLIRNDLSQVANQVTVSQFRFIDEIKTNEMNLLQVSSEITGVLPSTYLQNLGNILIQLLPAGSISGAPKAKTVSIIQRTEQEKRGYYTGVFGYFDGDQLNSGVMIRYIEKSHGKFFYRSGGGITTQSKAMFEYQETINKVYVPVD